MFRTPHIAVTTSMAILLQAPPEGILGAIIGSTFPDIDIKIGLVHRTWTHWLPFYIFPAVYIFYSLNDPSFASNIFIKLFFSFLAWFCIGASMHILEDCITYSGIPLLSPTTSGYPPKAFMLSNQSRFSLMLTTSGGSLEKIIMIIVIAMVAMIFIRDSSYRIEYLQMLEHWLYNLRYGIGGI